MTNIGQLQPVVVEKEVVGEVPVEVIVGKKVIRVVEVEVPVIDQLPLTIVVNLQADRVNFSQNVECGVFSYQVPVGKSLLITDIFAHGDSTGVVLGVATEEGGVILAIPTSPVLTSAQLRTPWTVQGGTTLCPYSSQAGGTRTILVAGQLVDAS